MDSDCLYVLFHFVILGMFGETYDIVDEVNIVFHLHLMVMLNIIISLLLVELVR